MRVLVHTQMPAGKPRGHLVLVHGLEGSSESGYARSMAHKALSLGYGAHRFNMRSCGGTDELAVTAYHAGQTSDLLFVLREMRRTNPEPLFLVGFSLGANVALKLAGELAESASELLTRVAAISTPIDLAAGVRALARWDNRIYQNRFVGRLKERIARRHVQAPEIYKLEYLSKVRTIEDFDEYYTAQLFGFGSAQNYFRTQSCGQFLEHIRVPTLMLQAKDDPMIPFSSYDLPVFQSNPYLRLITPDYGGHLGFLSRQNPRFWADEVMGLWLDESKAY